MTLKSNLNLHSRKISVVKRRICRPPCNLNKVVFSKKKMCKLSHAQKNINCNILQYHIPSKSMPINLHNSSVGKVNVILKFVCNTSIFKQRRNYELAHVFEFFDPLRWPQSYTSTKLNTVAHVHLLFSWC